MAEFWIVVSSEQFGGELAYGVAGGAFPRAFATREAAEAYANGPAGEAAGGVQLRIVHLLSDGRLEPGYDP